MRTQKLTMKIAIEVITSDSDVYFLVNHGHEKGIIHGEIESASWR